MINLICQTNKCKRYIICNNWVSFLDKLTILLFHPASNLIRCIGVGSFDQIVQNEREERGISF